MEVRRCRFIEHIPGEIMCLSVMGQHCVVVFADSSIFLYKVPSWALVLAYPSTKFLDLRKVL